MEQHDTLTGMLDLMTYPAFCVKDDAIVYANRPAQAHLLATGTPVSQILFTGVEEYAAFSGGCLYLTLCIGGTYRGASVTRMGEYDVLFWNLLMTYPLCRDWLLLRRSCGFPFPM